MENKNAEDQKKETVEAAEKVAKAGFVNRLVVQIGQKVGIIECTKLEPRYERNINKLISYHNIIYNIVDCIELQVQYNPAVLVTKRVVSAEGENLWEMIGGWLHYMSLAQYEGNQSHILKKYSYACGKIAQKEAQMQRKTRTHLIRNMRLYTGPGSLDLNAGVAMLHDLLHGIDKTRHHLYNARTVKDVKTRGEEYRKMIRGFNDEAYTIQGWIDEVSTVVTLHQNELMKFAHQLSLLHNNTFNQLNETLLRLNYKVKKC